LVLQGEKEETLKIRTTFHSETAECDVVDKEKKEENEDVVGPKLGEFETSGGENRGPKGR